MKEGKPLNTTYSFPQLILSASFLKLPNSVTLLSFHTLHEKGNHVNSEKRMQILLR